MVEWVYCVCVFGGVLLREQMEMTLECVCVVVREKTGITQVQVQVRVYCSRVRMEIIPVVSLLRVSFLTEQADINSIGEECN